MALLKPSAQALLILCWLKFSSHIAPMRAHLAHRFILRIVDTAVSAGNFNTLATALKAAGLIDTLKGAGPFTVFAPTDAMHEKTAWMLRSLLED